MFRPYNPRNKSAFLGGFLSALFLFSPAQSAEPGQLFTFFQAEQFEYRANDGQDSLNWDAQGWIGNDDHKVWLKTEGEKPTDGRLEKGEFQL
ncbi:MAG: copper resistance protein B, partial [Alphaproteobacteria bacterium]|nr:copper resistance protein B [Alphaproteobacteria bacterium]